ncbi:hypothetical protein AA313_de0208245 [Arthrobotrys entomopaga]|nr:hypothetical protein AA313_de0208245 [Arthrobotrys entomopaga]
MESWSTLSPSSHAISDCDIDAAGTPNLLQPHVSTFPTLEANPDDVNALARKRDQDDDEAQGIKCRKASVTKRQRSAPKSSSNARRRRTEIRRPRDPKFTCESIVSGEKCGKKFTRERDFEVHFRTHGKALHICECRWSYSRKDNLKKHLASPKHKQKMAEIQAKKEQQLALAALSLTLTPTFSMPSSSPSWSSSESFPSPHLDGDYQMEFSSF